MIPELESALAAGAPLHETAAELGAVRVGEDELRRFGDPERLLLNVNTPAELQRAAKLL